MFRKMHALFSKMPVILILIILIIVVFDNYIPLIVKEFLYAMALTMKAIIIFLLPLIIFGLLLKATILLSKNATRIILLALIFVCCSNFISTFLAHFVGEWVYHFNLYMLKPIDTHGDLIPLWTLTLPKLISNVQALFGGIILGILIGRFCPNGKAIYIAKKAEDAVKLFLKNFIYMIPFFVAGFATQLQHSGVIGIIFKEYTIVFVFICLAQFGYILLMYLLLSHFKIKEYIRMLKNMIPPVVSGFSTMSSAATMPLTLIAAEENAKDKQVANAIIPTTVNIHLIGDCFAITIFAYAVLKSFGMAEPSFMVYLTFALYFVLAKFSVAGVPGGGILIMLPILETHLGFQAPMLSMMTGLYILFDPIITSANVLGNGAFAKFMDNFLGWRKASKHKHKIGTKTA